MTTEYGVKCKAYKMPAEDSTVIDKVVGQITKEMGELDVVIANAGVCIHVDATVSNILCPPYGRLTDHPGFPGHH